MVNDPLCEEWLNSLQNPPEYVYPTRINVHEGMATCNLSVDNVPKCGKLNTMEDAQPKVCAVNKNGSQGLPKNIEEMALCGMCMRR